MRCIGLLKYREVEDIVPYYTEALIHLKVLFDSGVIYTEKNTVKLHLNDSTYQMLKV